ncbi:MULTISPECIES: DUF4956 domain-containing protein [Maribacter]|uniref:DUF4956 domain-containing protein n=1 Tax=Maribacter TaxID=252356 RepID=UPI00047C84EF|nr:MULTISPECIES: DUF4956 domain-containing protein [Maribacter]|tara:strand:+ start:1682 stop:2359 length:678 start_codon:yes stop_codon:yes gene_type:complete
MNELLSQFELNSQENFSILTFLLNIIIAIILLFILSKLYVKYGNSISNREQLSRVFILVGVTTFIIISIVKSSLALSLGLVGALSIVRFRTAIKEPEELGFFFISIAVGLGMGANQFLPTFTGFVLLALVIVLMKKNKLSDSISQNLILSLPTTDKNGNEIIDQISSVLSMHTTQLEMKRLNITKENFDVNFLINLSNLEGLQVIAKELKNLDADINITFIDSGI